MAGEDKENAEPKEGEEKKDPALALEEAVAKMKAEDFGGAVDILSKLVEGREWETIPLELHVKARTRLIHALCRLGREDEADDVRIGYKV